MIEFIRIKGTYAFYKTNHHHLTFPEWGIDGQSIFTEVKLPKCVFNIYKKNVGLYTYIYMGVNNLARFLYLAHFHWLFAAVFVQ
jgi:hypothetical protein